MSTGEWPGAAERCGCRASRPARFSPSSAPHAVCLPYVEPVAALPLSDGSDESYGITYGIDVREHGRTNKDRERHKPKVSATSTNKENDEAPSHSRYDYVPIHQRPQYTGPAAQRLAVTFCNNIEYFAFGAGLGCDSTGARGAAEPAQLRVARLRQPRRHLALFRPARRVRLPGAHNVNSLSSNTVPTSSSA